MPGGCAADVAVVEPQAEGGLVLDGGGVLRRSHGGEQGSVRSCAEGSKQVTWDGWIYTWVSAFRLVVRIVVESYGHAIVPCGR